tara:strand:- start:47 stop:568 length:522 start_codon:yes stop_codon:yes gene_type:complete
MDELKEYLENHGAVGGIIKTQHERDFYKKKYEEAKEKDKKRIDEIDKAYDNVCLVQSDRDFWEQKSKNLKEELKEKDNLINELKENYINIMKKIEKIEKNNDILERKNQKFKDLYVKKSKEFRKIKKKIDDFKLLLSKTSKDYEEIGEAIDNIDTWDIIEDTLKINVKGEETE